MRELNRNKSDIYIKKFIEDFFKNINKYIDANDYLQDPTYEHLKGKIKSKFFNESTNVYEVEYKSPGLRVNRKYVVKEAEIDAALSNIGHRCYVALIEKEIHPNQWMLFEKLSLKHKMYSKEDVSNNIAFELMLKKLRVLENQKRKRVG